MSIQVRPSSEGGFELVGLDRRMLSRLVGLANAAREAQAALADADRSELRRQLLRLGFDPVPPSVDQQAARTARRREQLLAEGAYDTAALARLLGYTAGSVRDWLSRHRRAGELFTVSLDGRAFLPTFFVRDGALSSAAAAVSRALLDEGLGPWEAWTWLATTSSWLDGRRPVDLLDERPELVLQAAESQLSGSQV